jgi:steroid 5-alpha reductase family enzyme
MELVNTIMTAALILLVYMTVMFILAILVKDNSIADVAWGLGFIIVALSLLVLGGSFFPRQVLVTGMIVVWGLRLAIRIFRRNWGKGEDTRYRKWREEWGRLFLLRSYLQVFILQGAILLVNIMPVLIIHTTSDATIGFLDVIGLLVWICGFLFESVGDWQLDRFVRDPKNRGKIMDTGLWRYSRHPNYFGEVTMWWGIFIIALSVPWGWIGVVGPMIITSMILFVSGVPMTERLMEKTPGFAEYRKKTSVFIPWFPKR